MNMVRLLVTGGSGFIGSNLIEKAISEGYEVLSLDKKLPRNNALIEYHRTVDILHKDELFAAYSEFKPNYVIHLAARTDLDGAEEVDYIENTVGTRNLIDAIKIGDSAVRVIFASSRLVCNIGYVPKDEFDTNGSTPYGKSKIMGEKIVREADLINEWIIVRPTSIWGPWFGVPYNTFFNILRRGLYIHPKNKKIYKSFGYVGNTVYQLIKLLHAESDIINKKTFFLCDYPAIEVSSWALKIQNEFNVKIYREVPERVLRFIAFFGDILKKLHILNNPPLTSFRLDNLISQMTYKTESLERICGPLPFSLDAGIEKTVKWMNEN